MNKTTSILTDLGLFYITKYRGSYVMWVSVNEMTLVGILRIAR
jgi:hypothetical protein